MLHGLSAKQNSQCAFLSALAFLDLAAPSSCRGLARTWAPGQLFLCDLVTPNSLLPKEHVGLN